MSLRSSGLQGSIILQQPLDVIELFLRPADLAIPLAQFLDDAASALHVDLARHFDVVVVAVFAAAQRPAQRIGILVGALAAEAAEPTGALPHLLLHGLRQRLRALAQLFERAALGVDRTFGVVVAEIAFGLAHGVAGAAELVHLALTLLAL